MLLSLVKGVQSTPCSLYPPARLGLGVANRVWGGTPRHCNKSKERSKFMTPKMLPGCKVRILVTQLLEAGLK